MAWSNSGLGSCLTVTSGTLDAGLGTRERSSRRESNLPKEPLEIWLFQNLSAALHRHAILEVSSIGAIAITADGFGIS